MLSFNGFDGFYGGGPRVVVSTAAFHAGVRGSVPDLGGLKKNKMFFPHPRVKLSILGNLRARPQTARARISNPVSGGHVTVSSDSSHNPQEVLPAHLSLSYQSMIY